MRKNARTCGHISCQIVSNRENNKHKMRAKAENNLGAILTRKIRVYQQRIIELKQKRKDWYDRKREREREMKKKRRKK